jgi:hypothetical protein
MSYFRGETRSAGAKNAPQTAKTTRQNSAETHRKKIPRNETEHKIWSDQRFPFGLE